MKIPLLVRHPPPYPTESLPGYVLRLSEENGYRSPWALCLLGGMKQSEVRTSGFKLEKLAAITNRAPSELDNIGFSAPVGQPRWARLLGNQLVPTELNITSPWYCPLCVAEKGFIEAYWHLTLMVACPIHLRRAASNCPKCGKVVRWFRAGLLECECGGNLLNGDMPSISRPEASLLEVIKRKALTDLTDQENPVSLPVSHLMAMNLRSMLSVIRALGKYRLIANECTVSNDQMQIVVAAAEVLKYWPTNFIKLLNDLGERLPTINGGVAKQFEGIYHALFRNKAIQSREQVNFLTSAFLDFAMNHWGRGFVDHKLLRNVRGDAPSRFLTQTDFAARLGVQQRTAARLLRSQEVTSRRVKCGKVERVVVDTDQRVLPRDCPGRILRGRAAAKQLGLSVSVLRALKRTGEFEVTHLLPTRAGFHELDVDQFSQKLLGLVPAARRAEFRTHEHVALRDIMHGRHDSPEIKANVVRALLSKEIPVEDNVDGSIGGLSLNRHTYHQFIREARCSAAGNAKTPREVAGQLLCDASAVPGLMRLGLLQGSETPVGLRITDESVAAFKRQFIFLAAIAKNENTSSRALMRRCAEGGIRILSVPIGSSRGPQPFIRAEDGQMLLGKVAAPVCGS